MWKKAEKSLSKDKYIGPLIKKHGPCSIRPSKRSEYFQDLVYSIVGQQLSMKAAATIYERLKGELDGEVVPEKILRKRDSTLRKCGLSFSKITYVKELSERVAKGKLNLKGLDKLDDDEVANELIAVKGIGRWTADMFLMFSLARPNIFPLEDLGIVKGSKLLFKKNLSAQKIGKKAEIWKPFRTVAAWYIWRNLDEV